MSKLYNLLNNFNHQQTIKSMIELKTPQMESLNFNFGLSLFENVIAENFRSVQNMLINQQAQISQLKSIIERPEIILPASQRTVPEKQSNERAKKITAEKNIEADLKDMEEKIQQKPQQTISSVQKQSIITQTIQQNEPKPSTPPLHLPLPPIPPIPQGQIPLIPKQSKQSETNPADLSISDVGIKLMNNDIIQEKIFQLFQRVRRMEEKESNSERFSLKKFREIEFQLQEAAIAVEKGRKTMDQFDETVESLRNQISEYKLKKESKIMKALNSSSINMNQTSSGDNYDYMAEKMRFLLKHVNQMLTKKSFQQERQILQQNIQNLRRKINENINESFFEESMKSLETRVYQTVAKHIKAMQFAPTGQKGSDQLDAIIEQGNREFSQRVSEHQQKIKDLNQDLALLKASLEVNRKEKLQFEEEVSQQIRQNQQKTEILGHQMEEIRKYIQELKSSLDQKQMESENQIIDIQESLEKVKSTLKSYAFLVKESPLRASSTPNDNPEQLLEKANNNAELENDFKSQQKKFNKLQGKVQSLKEDILAYRQDLMREIDGVKANLQKKADWESLKKGLNYFEEKLKETKAVTQALYEAVGKDDSGESLAVKKGWTCLVCDKDIKNYEGKLGQLKFTSMFPVRESPRIGGYYKQQQASQEYKQVFLSNSNLNNRSRRIGSLKSKDSKEELH